MWSHSAQGNRRPEPRVGFTIPELLVVIGVIAVLLAVLLPALIGAKRTADMAKSQSNMKQIATWMTQYSSEHREIILPSQFNYSDPSNPNAPAGGFPVNVRSDDALSADGLRYRGTWSDIIWEHYRLGSAGHLIDPNDAANEDKYLYDSPDRAVYEFDTSYENVLRSAAPNSRDYRPNCADGTGALPFGTGASEAGLPGFFAANNFFNADRDAPPYVDPGGNSTATPLIGRWYTTGQIKSPSRSMYLVDSFAGETINPVEDAGGEQPFNTAPVWDCGAGSATVPALQVDFRYTGNCIMMFLDGSVSTQTPWDNLAELQGQRRIKVQWLDRN